jgi:hypothetical protein
MGPHVSLDKTGLCPYAPGLLYPVDFRCRGIATRSPYRCTSLSALPRWLQNSIKHLILFSRGSADVSVTHNYFELRITCRLERLSHHSVLPLVLAFLDSMKFWTLSRELVLANLRYGALGKRVGYTLQLSG